MAAVPVTLFTTWGVLRGGDDFVEGNSISVTSGSDGAVRVTLRPPITLDSNEDQDALETILAQLDPASASPNDVRVSFQNMAQQYRWEANHNFRNAVDAYFRNFGQKTLQGSQFRDSMVAWSLIPATVVAYAGGTGLAATITIKLRDWLAPWLQVYREYIDSQVKLAPDLQFIKKNAGSAAGLLAGVFGTVGSTVDAEFGEIGKKIATETARKALDTFVNTGISDLPADMRSSVGTALSTGARSLGTVGTSVIAALGNAHVTALVAANSLTSKLDRTEFQSAISLKANASDVQASLAAKADVVTMQNMQAKFETALGSKASMTDLQAVQASVATKADLTTFETFQKNTNDAIARKVDSAGFEEFRKQVGDKLQITATKTDLSAIQNTINTKADNAALISFQSETKTALRAKANSTDLETIRGRVTAVERKVP
jgi:hypothetical protein